MVKTNHNYASIECPDCGKMWVTDYEPWVKSFRDYCREKACMAKSVKDGTHPNWIKSFDREDKPPKKRIGKFDPSTGEYHPLIGDEDGKEHMVDSGDRDPATEGEEGVGADSEDSGGGESPPEDSGR